MADPSLQDRIRADLNSARKARDQRRTVLLGTVVSELRNREIEIGRPASDEDVEALLATAIKRRREAAEQMEAGGRPELAEKEAWEGEVLRGYLPEPLSEAEVRGMVREAIAGGASGLGEVMKAVIPGVKGRFEGKEVHRLAREELADG